MKRPAIEKIIEDRFLELGEVRIHSSEYIFEDDIFVLELLTEREIVSEKEVSDFIEEQLGAKCQMKFTKAYFDFDFLKRKVEGYFFSDNAFLKNKINDETLKMFEEEGKICVVIKGTENFCSFISTQFVDRLESYLYRSFIKEFEIRTEIIEDLEEKLPKRKDISFERAIIIDDLCPYLGKPEGEVPAFIIDIEEPCERAILAGRISKLEKRTKKNPPKPMKRGKPNEHYFTFYLTDPSGTIKCIIFPSVSNNRLVEKLGEEEVEKARERQENKESKASKESESVDVVKVDDKSKEKNDESAEVTIVEDVSKENNKTTALKDVILSGKIDYSFSGDLQMVVKTISLCNVLTKDPPPPKNLKTEPLYYQKVFPEPVIVTEQQSLLVERKKTDVSKFVGKTIVVFDLETTGLRSDRDKIIEIGAVKIVDGVFTEKFSTLINPQCHIPEGASAVNNIYDVDVKYAPVIDDVMGDFFKFTYGTTLCGHNVKSFDMKFLREEARRLDYTFDNPVIDTLEFAMQFVRGSKNNKLGSLCEYFGFENENAHRAYEDSIATGKVLIYMAERYDELII